MNCEKVRSSVEDTVNTINESIIENEKSMERRTKSLKKINSEIDRLSKSIEENETDRRSTEDEIDCANKTITYLRMQLDALNQISTAITQLQLLDGSKYFQSSSDSEIESIYATESTVNEQVELFEGKMQKQARKLSYLEGRIAEYRECNDMLSDELEPLKSEQSDEIAAILQRTNDNIALGVLCGRMLEFLTKPQAHIGVK